MNIPWLAIPLAAISGIAVAAVVIIWTAGRRIRLLEIRLDAARRRLAGTRIADPANYRAWANGAGVAVERITPSGAVPVWYTSTRGMTAPARDRTLDHARTLAAALNQPLPEMK